MDIAAIILAILSLLMSGVALTWQLVKHFSTKELIYVDPLSSMAKNKGNLGDPFEAYREIGEPNNSKTPPIGDDI